MDHTSGLSRYRSVAAWILVIILGVFVGVSGYTFVYAEGASYLTNNPASCANCHVMNEQFDGWTKSSHHAVATCNDCHTPHNFFGKYLTKGINGWNHSWAFTMQNFHEPIQITPRNRAITESACRSCHEVVTHSIDPDPPAHRELSCIRCHASVGHQH